MIKNTVLILPDVHIPSHNPNYLAAWLDFLKRGFTEVVIIGDLFDADTLKRFPRNPGRTDTLGSELRETQKFLEKLCNIVWHPGVGEAVHYLEGNHEERYRNYYWKHAPALWGTRRTIPPRSMSSTDSSTSPICRPHAPALPTTAPPTLPGMPVQHMRPFSPWSTV